ncbi:hypothetical protein OD632_005116 [Salmonella enterica]|nr:hypothetical protein [Salmonella enterica]
MAVVLGAVYRVPFTLDGCQRLCLSQPRRQGLKRGNGTRCGNEQGRAATSGRGSRNGVAPYIPASSGRDAGSAGYGATKAAHPFTDAASRVLRIRP